MIKTVWWKSKLFWILSVGMIYLLLGLLIVPPLIKNQLTTTIETHTKLNSTVENIKFDPITFTLRLRKLNLRASDKSMFETDQITINFDPIASLYRWDWSFGNITINSPQVTVRRNKSGVINWTRFGQSQESTDNVTTHNDTGFYTIDNFRLKNGNISWSDRSLTPPADLTLSEIDFTLKNIKWSPRGNSSLNLRSQIGNEGSLRARAKIFGDSLSINSDVSIADFPLYKTNDYLQGMINGKWGSGRLDLRGTFQASLSPLKVDIKGNGRLNNMNLLDSDGDPVVTLKKTTIDNMKFRWPKRQFEVGLTKIDEPHLVLHIDENYRFNLEKLFIAQNTPDSSTKQNSTWSGSVGPIKIRSARLDFIDENVQGLFQTNIVDLDGTMEKVSTAKNDSASVSLNGRLDQQSTVNIDGSINPFSVTSRSNIKINVKNIGLPTLSQYSAKFFGYNINRGKMLLSLEYQSDNGKLSGNNYAEMNQLTLGNQVEGARFSLPMKLAVALLKNQNGIIKMDVPVTGDVNDPQFNFSKVIRQSIHSAFQSIVSSPFSFLAGLANTEADKIKYVEFEPAKSKLTKRAENGLEKLSDVLEERPLIELGVQPAWFEIDRQQFARELLNDHLRDQGKTPDRLERSASALENRLIQVSSSEKLSKIRQNHRSRDDNSFTNVQGRESYTRSLYESIVRNTDIKTANLKDIAKQRASIIRKELRKDGIESERIFVLETTHLQTSSSDSVVEIPLRVEG